MLTSVLLALGVVVATPVAAYAATESHVALPSGVRLDFSMNATYAPFGSTIVAGYRVSTDAGATWTWAPTTHATEAVKNQWVVGSDGKLARLAYMPGGIGLIDVWNPSTGEFTSYYAGLPDSILSYNTSVVLSPGNYRYDPAGYSVYNFVTGVSTGNVRSDFSPGVTPNQPSLTSSGAVLWSAYQGGKTWWTTAADIFSLPLPWITNAAAVVATPTGLQYAVADGTGLRLCTRGYLSGTSTCVAGPTGDMSNKTVTLSNFGSATIVSIFAPGRISAGNYVWTSTGVKALPPLGVALPDSVTHVYGDSLYVVFRTGAGVPSIQRVNADGTLGKGLNLPSVSPLDPSYLAVGPDRVLGTDTRDGSTTTTSSWTRSTAGSSLGTETLNSLQRVDSTVDAGPALVASAGRSVMAYGRSSTDSPLFRNLDRGQDGYISSGLLKALSGPYLLWVDPQLGGGATLVTTVTNAAVASPSSGQLLFGSQVLAAVKDAIATGVMRIVVTDLTGASATKTYALPSGTAACDLDRTWGDTVSLNCPGTVEIYNYRTGILLGSHQHVGLTSLGDGYAVVDLGQGVSAVWAFASDTLSTLPCGHTPVDDGVGQLACWDTQDLIWEDYSELSTSAPRLLGVLFASSVNFAARPWTPEIDTTKPLNAGSLVITAADGTVVKTLATPASADGSLRGLSWDGTDAGGVPVPSGTYTAELVASATDGSGAVRAVDGVAAPRFQVTPQSPGSFVALTPSRLLDTRVGSGGTGPIAAAGVVDLQVTGLGGVPADGVGSVVLNVTAVTPTGPGYLTVFPSGTAAPNASNLNFTPGQVVPNLVLAKVGSNGKVSIKNGSGGKTELVVDVAGYFISGTVTDPGGVTAVAPSRLLETRVALGGTGPVAPYGTVKVQVTGRGGVPATGVSAVVVNLTAVTPTGAGYLTAYPTGGTAPLASNVNFVPGLVVPNLAFVKLGSDGSFTILNGSAGVIEVVADVAGYVIDGTVTGSGMFVALTPSRILDTRTSAAVGAGEVKTLTVAGAGGVPATGISGIVLNVTVVAGAGPGYLTVYPADVAAPLASNLNFIPGQVVPNLVAVKTSKAGAVNIRNASGTATQVIADVAGYFTA